MPAQLSKFRTENPRRSSIVNGGISVRVEDGTEEGIQFTVPWNYVALSCMRNNAKPVPRQKVENRMDLILYYGRMKAKNEEELKTIVDQMNWLVYSNGRGATQLDNVADTV